ncbi:MAG TPA: hypothetical protein VGM50_13680 [Gemmatimonadaceae bacterium]|jgi:hypothetical protein
MADIIKKSGGRRSGAGRRKGIEHLIVDHHALARVIDEAISLVAVEAGARGAQRRFGERCGLNPAVISELLTLEPKPKRQRMSDDTYKGLRRGMSTDDLKDELDAAIHNKACRSIHAAHRAAVYAELLAIRTKARRSTRWVSFEGAVRELRGDDKAWKRVSLFPSEMQRAVEIDLLVQYVRAKFAVACITFENKTKQHGDDRQALAYYRAMSPLAEAAEGGFIERHWTELSDKELLRFLQRGLEREEILLRREPAAVRAQRIAIAAPIASERSRYTKYRKIIESDSALPVLQYGDTLSGILLFKDAAAQERRRTYSSRARSGAAE